MPESLLPKLWMKYQMHYRFNYLAAGGTFDRIHKGHKAFLTRAFELGKKVVVGITSDEFAKQKPYGQFIEPFEKRRQAILNFLKVNNLVKRTKILQLSNRYGPTLDPKNEIEAILVTKKTKKGADLINQKRQALGLAPLKIITTDLITNSGSEPISSQDVRVRLLTTTLFLPRDLRPFLKKPFGKLLSGSEEDLRVALQKTKKMIIKDKPRLLVCVGDVVTKLLNEAQITIDLAIVDFRIKRQKAIKNLKELGFAKNRADFTVANKPGKVSFKLAHAIEQALRVPSKKQVIRVLGEEDLAVLPALVFAPEGTLILYGQPGEGIVAVDVNKNTRKRAIRLANKFENKLN